MRAKTDRLPKDLPRRSRAALAGMLFMTITAICPPGAQAQHSGAFAHAAVAADHDLASRAGVEILRQGGNAVDAAVATSFALSVVRPYSCGIGGGGFMVIHLKDHPRLGPVTTTINYREAAPAAARPGMFEGDPDPDAATHGGKAVAVPGTVAGLLHALEKYGTMPREKVLAPAITLAERGFDADRHYVDSARDDSLVLPWYAKDPGRRERFPFLWTRFLMEGQVKVGDRVHVPEQAAALRLIAALGRAGFYEGEVAAAVVEAVNRAGGAMTLEDLAGYRVEEREPLRAEFRGLSVLTMPPPSSGGIVLAQVLGMLERREADVAAAVREGHNSAGYIHLVTECSKHAFADRARWMGDPNFVMVPLRGLLAPEYIAARAAAIDLTRTRATEGYGTSEPFPDDAGTSHLCVIDGAGGAVACTETINLIFGAHVAVEKYGFILNDEMDDFLTRAGKGNAFGLDHANLNRPQGGKRPLSSMTPTIFYDDGGVRLIAGGAGGPRIMSGTIQAALNVLVWGMPAERALREPRFHHQWHPDRLDLEPPLRGGAVEAALRERGHATAERKAVANVQVIRRCEGGWDAASDPRKGGVPAGY